MFSDNLYGNLSSTELQRYIEDHVRGTVIDLISAGKSVHDDLHYPERKTLDRIVIHQVRKGIMFRKYVLDACTQFLGSISKTSDEVICC